MMVYGLGFRVYGLGEAHTSDTGMQGGVEKVN